MIVVATLAALTVLAPTASASSDKDGAFHLAKVCNAAGDTCVVTVSNSRSIPVGTTITYVGASFDALVATIHADHGTATGTCNIQPVIDGTGPGRCTFDGGTGSLRHLHLTVAVTTIDFETWFWDGTPCNEHRSGQSG